MAYAGAQHHRQQQKQEQYAEALHPVHSNSTAQVTQAKNRRKQHPDKRGLNTVATSRSWRGFPAAHPGVLPAAGVSMPPAPLHVKPFVRHTQGNGSVSDLLTHSASQIGSWRANGERKFEPVRAA